MTGKANLILTLWDVKNEYKAKCNKYSKELTTDSEVSRKTLLFAYIKLINIIIIIWIIEQGKEPRYSTEWKISSESQQEMVVSSENRKQIGIYVRVSEFY